VVRGKYVVKQNICRTYLGNVFAATWRRHDDTSGLQKYRALKNLASKLHVTSRYQHRLLENGCSTNFSCVWQIFVPLRFTSVTTAFRKSCPDSWWKSKVVRNRAVCV